MLSLFRYESICYCISTISIGNPEQADSSIPSITGGGHGVFFSIVIYIVCVYPIYLTACVNNYMMLAGVKGDGAPDVGNICSDDM